MTGFFQFGIGGNTTARALRAGEGRCVLVLLERAEFADRLVPFGAGRIRYFRADVVDVADVDCA